jgi:deazaflavin-dependent oxidoreductase (nitroreductase family)
MSVKVPPRGTRGVPFPRFMTKLANRFVLRQFRRGGARTQGGVHTLLLETTGARSGQPRQSVLGYIDEGEGSWLVIASAAGAKWHPSWLHNLAASQDATIRFEDGRTFPVRAETLEGAALATAWERIAVDAPEYVKYRSQTDREIPVVRLRAR